MAGTENKYDKVVEKLRRSMPATGDQDLLTEKIMQRIAHEKEKSRAGFFIYDLLFGWVYVGWIRRSLLVLSLAVVLMIIGQQAVIINRLKDMSLKTYSEDAWKAGEGKYDIYATQIIHRVIAGDSLDAIIRVSDRELENFARSVEKLQSRYKNILRIIGDNPELARYIESRLDGINDNSKRPDHEKKNQ